MNRPRGSPVPVRETISLCPQCLTRIPARIMEIDGEIYMCKVCPEHGEFRTVIWRDSKENYLRWLDYGGEKPGPAANNPDCGTDAGCPYDCGICVDHRQETCSAAIMVTSRCNLDCPVCFTRTPGDTCHEPDLGAVRRMMEDYLHSCGRPHPVELCGGEPTVRDDLPEIISMGKEMGFDYIQLNTNGLRIAGDKDYPEKLKEAGLTTVYLGLDGITADPYLYSCGRNLLPGKLQALENCARAGLAVILVPCVMPGINDRQIGAIIRLAKEWMPAVKGVHFQPISYFGKYPSQPRDMDRITIPEVIRAIEEQTGGEIKKENFLPAGCEHPQCSFHGFFWLNSAGRLQALTKFGKRDERVDGAEKTRLFTRKYWTYSEMKSLTVGGMAFQDAWNIDLERLRRCIIHIIGPGGKYVPLCAKYLTGMNGERIYPGIS